MPELKKTAALWLPEQLRMDQDVAAKIRHMAEKEDRTIQGQIRYLIKLGMRVAEGKKQNKKQTNTLGLARLGFTHNRVQGD